MPEPVTVGVYLDRIEVTSIPGPDRSIPDIDIKNGSMRSRIYRNRRIGDFLERLGLAEVKNTGMITIAGSMSENGSPEAVFMTDEARTYLTVVLPVHKAFLGADKVSGKRTTEQITKEVLAIIDAEGEIGLRDLAEKMGYVSVPSSLKNAVSVLRASGVLEYTEAKPNSPNQKIRKRKTGSARTEP